jgi:hypothetical protein
MKHTPYSRRSIHIMFTAIHPNLAHTSHAQYQHLSTLCLHPSTLAVHSLPLSHDLGAHNPLLIILDAIDNLM